MQTPLERHAPCTLFVTFGADERFYFRVGCQDAGQIATAA